MEVINRIEQPTSVIVGVEKLINHANTYAFTKYLGSAKDKKVAMCQLFSPPNKKKLKKAEFVEEMIGFVEYLEVTGVKVIGVTNADYFKFMTGSGKFELNIGRALDGIGVLTGYTVVPLLNTDILKIYSNKNSLFLKGMAAFNSSIDGTYTEEVKELTTSEVYTNYKDAMSALSTIINEPSLAVDIEATGLKFTRDKLLTISFAKDEDHAICIAIHPQYHSEAEYKKIIKVLKGFFEQYKGVMIGHNFSFDLAFIAHEIYRGRDYSKSVVPFINGVKVFDTMIAAYLCLNSTDRPDLSLKSLSFDKYGEYDVGIDQKNLIAYPLEQVAAYNNLDVSATQYLYKKFKPLLIEEEQDKVYEELYSPMIKTMLKVKMNGLVVDKEVARKGMDELVVLINEDMEILQDDIYIRDALAIIRELEARKYNAKTKTKKKTADDFLDKTFNPNSTAHKRVLLFDVLDLPVISRTKTKEPSTDKEAFAEWMITDDEELRTLLQMVIDIVGAGKVKNTYLNKFLEDSVEVRKGEWRIFGNFNLTGTLSGRLSSNDPNLQNMPSGSKYGKLIKKCFPAPEGMLFGGSDFAAIEDRLIAMEAECPAKMKVFTDGYDGHSLNTAAYFKDQLEDRGLFIDTDSAKSVNSIQDLAGDLRGKSKTVTFGMSYGSMAKKVASTLKIPLAEAEVIFNAYWELYKEIKQYNTRNTNFAREHGYVISRFSGLKLRTPKITTSDEFLRSKEERVLNNMKIQSGNILTIKALIKFQDWIEENDMSDKIEIINTIHDAIYLYIKEDLEVIELTNKVLIEFMGVPYKENQELPLSSELDIGYTWADQRTLENNCTTDTIYGILHPELKYWEK